MPNVSNTVQIHFRINQLQYELLRTKAHTSGFKTVASYVRHALFREPYILERMVKEIHEEIVKKDKKSHTSHDL